MNDEQLIVCAALCGLAAYLGYQFAQAQAAAQASQQAAAAPLDGTAWLMAGGWRA